MSAQQIPKTNKVGCAERSNRRRKPVMDEEWLTWVALGFSPDGISNDIMLDWWISVRMQPVILTLQKVVGWQQLALWVFNGWHG